ncbi:unnamed protein product [Spirodela intermedia]|uniref:Uncharacterized protein n=2 Tax=Spirodela intermedia TaxID=51605 RepID=A0A7I8J7X5_SPIIN|nr:unnamed protein product [Spirodela intermedia]CAA6666338.1 unnamed protein product [Spirodela intermedia]CAA7403117.1 unnamed protein product [Spirodela intermedia]
MTKRGAEKMRPVQGQPPGRSLDWKYMSMVAAPPMDSPKRKAGRSSKGLLRRVWRKKDSEAAATPSISPR